jgi:hypothetical protein
MEYSAPQGDACSEQGGQKLLGKRNWCLVEELPSRTPLQPALAAKDAVVKGSADEAPDSSEFG